MTYSTSYFEVSAQLIPVLFLAMVVEDRLQPTEEESPRERVTRSWVLASLVAGEILSLAVIAGGVAGSRGVGNLVALFMLFSGFLIALPAIGLELDNGRSRRERAGHALAGLFVIALIVGVAVAVNL